MLLGYGGTVPFRSYSAVNLDLPWNLGKLEVEAKVVWSNNQVTPQTESRPAGVGVAFVNLGSGEREKLRQYIERFFELAAQIEQQAR